MPKHCYESWLTSAGDSQSDPLSINTEELTSQMMSLWLIKTFRPKLLYKAVIRCYVDNSGVDCWISKYAAKHAFQSKLLCLCADVELGFKCEVVPTWIRSNCADSLSRFPYDEIHGIKVLKINRKLFSRFKADVELAYGTMYAFSPAITNWYRTNLICTLPDGISKRLIEFASLFAT